MRRTQVYLPISTYLCSLTCIFLSICLNLSDSKGPYSANIAWALSGSRADLGSRWPGYYIYRKKNQESELEALSFVWEDRCVQNPMMMFNEKHVVNVHDRFFPHGCVEIILNSQVSINVLPCVSCCSRRISSNLFFLRRGPPP